MSRHWKGIIGLICIAVVGFVGLMLAGLTMIAFIELITAGTVAFVLAIAWARPQHPQEDPQVPAPDDRFPSLRQP
jgi:hypothetical protein